MQQICVIRARVSNNFWDVVDLRVKGKPFPREVFNWQGKSCNFFRAVVQELAMNTMPDIERLLEQELHNNDRAGDQNGQGGGRKPKVRGAQLMGIRRGGSF